MHHCRLPLSLSQGWKGCPCLFDSTPALPDMPGNTTACRTCARADRLLSLGQGNEGGRQPLGAGGRPLQLPGGHARGLGLGPAGGEGQRERSRSMACLATQRRRCCTGQPQVKRPACLPGHPPAKDAAAPAVAGSASHAPSALQAQPALARPARLGPRARLLPKMTRACASPESQAQSVRRPPPPCTSRAPAMLACSRR